MVSILVAISAVLVISLAWKAFCAAWLNPNKIEKHLKQQGIKGSPYKFLYGDIKQIVATSEQARAKPMELSHKIVAQVMPFYSSIAQKSGKICYLWFGLIPRVIVTDPDIIRDILSNKSGCFGKTRTNPFVKLLVTGVVSYEGEKWVKHRRIINPAFHQEKLKMMLPAFDVSCSEMINKWQSLILDESCEVDVWPHLQNLTADVISRTAFGSSYEEGRRIFLLQTEQAELVIQSQRSIYIPGFRFLPTKRNNRMKEISREVGTLLREMINKREKSMKAGDGPIEDLLGLLMESNFKEINYGSSKNSGMSIDDVIEECKLFYFAGQETTSTLLVWTMIVLSMHPDWQEKGREEVIRVFGKKAPDFDGLHHLKTITMILNEVLRLYPPVTTILRATYKKAKLGSVVLPPGVHILLAALFVHHDRDIWGEDVEEFNPERFSGGVSKAVNNNHGSFFPFGGGPRICIGQNFALIEAKIAISMILQNFSFELSSTYLHAPYAVITLKPQHGAQLILHKI